MCLFFFSLPSLRPLLDVNYLPIMDTRISRTFSFTNEGQALYLSSPTEIQRLTYSQEMCDNLQVSLATRLHLCYLNLLEMIKIMDQYIYCLLSTVFLSCFCLGYAWGIVHSCGNT